MSNSKPALPAERTRFAFLNREDVKDIRDTTNAAMYAEKAEASKIPKGAQVNAAKMIRKHSILL